MVLPTHPEKGEAGAGRAKKKKRRVHRMLLSIPISMLVSSLVINMNIRRKFKEKKVKVASLVNSPFQLS